MTSLVPRRRFLRGLGGVTLGLPLLDAFTARAARGAAPPAAPTFAAFIVEMNGVQQAVFDPSNGSLIERESFWPTFAPGPLTKAALEADSKRSLSVLAPYAEQTILAKGVDFAFPAGGAGCVHNSGGTQVLTAARYAQQPGRDTAIALGESVDMRIARGLTPGREPLALYAGPKSGFVNDHVSFRGPSDLIVGENNPYAAYMRMIGGEKPATSDLAKKIDLRRKSVNDLVRAQMMGLLSKPQLSADDRKRLDLHFSNIRDLELSIAATLPPDTVDSMKALANAYRNNDNRLKIRQLEFDILALAFASGYARVAVMQDGDVVDGIQYTIDGQKLPNFHHISHRVDGDNGGPPIAGAVELHRKVDVLRLGELKSFLDKLQAYDTPTGKLLDHGFVVWTNQVATGGHRYTGVPYVIVGKAGGFLKTGQFVDFKSVMNSRLLGTLINAAGVRKANGDAVDDFGDSTLPRAPLGELIA